VQLQAIDGNTDLQISNVQIDSRKVQKGSLFIAVKGVAVDGHQFIQKAIEQGAVAVISEAIQTEKYQGITYIQTKDSAEAAGIIAHNFFGQP
jgi:UDP-N-acetylmuramoyl-L-alanyl-D-glutamate--2,6-diaminopimelate ligase